MTRIVSIFILWVFALSACAELLLRDELPDLNIKQLAKSQQWYDLLHFEKSHLSSHPQSTFKNSQFYLTAYRNVDPEQELKALIDAIRNKNKEVLCRFPARVYWLRKQLSEFNFSTTSCDMFDEWFESIAAEGVSLIYPVAYLNSPSSMYGHTFIRMDSAKNNSELIDYSVSYAADSHEGQSQFEFLYKGLTGGAPGVFSILPYYEKVKEYSYLESRDVWSYKLDLNQEEVDQFVRHLWEIKDIHFDYYFFDENCSYQVLNLLDAASERFQLANQFSIRVIPVDTVKAMIEEELVNEISYRRSTISMMQSMIREIESEEEILIEQLVKSNVSISEIISQYSVEEQAKILDLAYAYSRYLSIQKKYDDQNIGRRSIAILSARSKLKLDKGSILDSQKNVISHRQIRNDEGHDSARVNTSFGYDGENHFLQTSIRAAYHDHLDSIMGFDPGAQLEMFDLVLRRTDYEKGYAFRLEALKLLDVSAYTVRNGLIKPVSWGVSFGLKRPQVVPEELVSYLNLSRGLSYSVQGSILYVMADAEINVDRDIVDNHFLGIGPRVGLLSQFGSWSSKLETVAYIDVSGARYKARRLSWEFAKSLSHSWQFRSNISANWFNDQDAFQSKEDLGFSFGLLHYF